MELSKSNHYELEYSLNTVTAYVNSKTGRLNIVFSEFSRNLGNLKIAWNLVYNSQLQYCDDVNKIDNHFTHSLNTYILPYQTSYNLEGFETGDYIFVDANSDIHNFKYYKTVNSEPYYYDTYGSGLVLRKTRVNYILEDLNQNKYFYDLNGRRINMRSGINSNIYKVINRNSSGRIINIYDNRKYNSKINFAYENNKLISIDNSFNILKFSYDSSRLKCVFEYKQSKYRKLYSFEYNENNELLYVIDHSIMEALEFEYTNNKVTKVTKKVVKKILDNASDDIYLNDEISLNENYFLNETKVRESDYDFSTVFYNEITYNDSYVKIVDNNNLTTINYFNTDYELINSLRLEGTKYYTDNKIYGYDMMELDYNTSGIKKTDFEINGDGYLRLNNNYLTSTEFSVAQFNERINESYATKSAFYRAELMVRLSNIANKEVKVRLILNNQSNTSAITGSFSSVEVPLQKTNADVWQSVSIPVYFHVPEMTVTSCQIEFVGASNDTIDVAYFYMHPSSMSFYKMDDDRIFHNITEIGYTTSSNDSVTYYPVNKNYYMSRNDIDLTLLNIKKASLNNISTFDLVLCDNRKRIEVTDFYLNFAGEKYNIYLGVLYAPNFRFIISSMDDVRKYLHKREFIYFEEDDDGKVLINYQSAQCCREDASPYVAGNVPYSLTTYNEYGMKVKEKDVCGNTKTYVYDSYGNLDEEIVKAIDGDELSTYYIYDVINEALKEYVACIDNGTDYKMLYVDSNEEVVHREEENTIIKEYEYDKFYDLTKKIKFKRTTDERLLNTYYFRYDNNGNVSEMRSSGGLKHSFEYNDLNLLSKVKDNLYTRENYTYSFNNNVSQPSVNIENAQIVTKVTKTKNLNNATVTNTNKKYYDKLGRLRLDVYNNNNQSCVYKYNKYNELEEVRDCFTNYTHKFERDPIYGLLMHSIKNNINDLVYYKEFITKNSIRYQFADGITRDTYSTYADDDKQYRLISTGDGDSDFDDSENDYTYNLTYNNAGLVEKVKSAINNGNVDFTKEINYNNTKDKIVKITHNADDSEMVDIYGYDSYGRLDYIEETSHINTNSVTLVKRIYYIYDEFNKLVEEDNSEFAYYTYEYDDDGNIIKIKSISNDVLKSFHYVNKKLINVTGIGAVTYDTYGNIIGLGTTKLQYGCNNKLSSITKNVDGVSVTENYYYDYQGIRYKKETIKNGTTEVTEYVYDGNKLLKETTKDSNGNVIREFKYYYNMQGICGIRYNGVNYTYVKDVLGNIRKILKGDNVICDYAYDAWGNQIVNYLGTLSSSDEYVVANKNPFRYRGYYYDVETQLYWVSSRYYSPELCRWISPDSIEYLDPENINGLNLYAYCNNDPVNKYDPTGHIAISLIVGLVVSFAIGTTASAISQYAQYGDVNWLQAGVDGLFAVASTALAYTGIGLIGSIAAGAGMGLAQYTLDSAVFHDDFSWSGALIATGLGALGGLASGRGAQHFKSIGSNLDDTGRTGVKAILTAFDKYGTGAGYQKVMNLWGGRVANSLAKSISQNFTKSALIIWGTTAATYGASYGLGQINWGF